MFIGARDKLVDKCLFTMMLMQLKAAALLQVLQNYLLKPNCFTHLANQ